MTAYYNEVDPAAAAALRALIADKFIAPGHVDERSIEDVSPADLLGYTQCHFFAGQGVWSYALRLAGWPDDRPVWTGSCPCFPAGTLVLTRRGLIPIEAVSVGDEVLTHKARWRTVTATGNEVSDTVVVKGQGHFGLQCTPNHPFLTGDDEWTSAADLKGRRWATVAEVPSGTVPPVGGAKRGYFYDKAASGFRVKGDKNGRPVYIGIFKTEQEAGAARREAVRAGKIDVRGADAVDPTSLAFARFLGYWVGDGWVSRDSVFICGAQGDADLLTSIAADARIPVNVSIMPTSARAHVGSKALSQWLREHFGEGADKKRLPAWLHSASAEYREAFLNGYWLADGHDETTKSGALVRRFTTVSRALAIGVRILLNQSGKSASITIHQQNRQVSIAGRLVSERPFYRVTAYEAARSFRFGGVHGWGGVRSVKPGLRCRVYNLAVDGDESYTADGIVVHNCQPFSAAGKGKGFDDERHLWPAFHWLIQQCRPDVVFGEQVAGKDGLGWLDLVATDLEALDYACGAVPFPAAGIGAPHIRERLYWMAHAPSLGWVRRGASKTGAEPCAIQRPDGLRDVSGVADDQLQQRPISTGLGDDPRGWQQEPAAVTGLRRNSRPGPTNSFWRDADWLGCRDGKWRPVEPGTFPLAHRAPARVGQLRLHGNAVVAPQAAAFIESYIEIMEAAE